MDILTALERKNCPSNDVKKCKNSAHFWILKVGKWPEKVGRYYENVTKVLQKVMQFVTICVLPTFVPTFCPLLRGKSGQKNSSKNGTNETKWDENPQKWHFLGVISIQMSNKILKWPETHF